MNITFSLPDISGFASILLRSAKSKTLCFYGDMGIGKTTLIQALMRQLRAVDRVSSPTFGLVNEYHNAQGEVLAYHFDFYRLNSEWEALDIGLEAYLNTDAWLLIEWPEKIEKFLPKDAMQIHISFVDEDTRTVSYNNN